MKRMIVRFPVYSMLLLFLLSTGCDSRNSRGWPRQPLPEMMRLLSCPVRS
ncbi:hypothetical protein ACFTAO_09785 [Paenibacillus rhizoplanae]